MRRFLIILSGLVIWASLWLSGNAQRIVNNSGTSSEDSLTVALPMNCDSACGDFIACDSFWVWVLKSNANGKIFADSGTTAMTGVDSIPDIIDGVAAYYWHRAVADIDGDGVTGSYAGVFVGKNTTYQLSVCQAFTFQIIGMELDEALDSAGIAAIKSGNALDSLQAQDGWVAHQTTSDSLYDSLLIVLDSLEALEAWVSHQSTSDSLYDSLLIILDSLEALESWVANEASITAIRDSLQHLVTATGFSTFDASSDSVIVDMSSFNGALDDDTTLVAFLRATVSASGLTATELCDSLRAAGTIDNDSAFVDFLRASVAASGLTATELCDSLRANGTIDNDSALVDFLRYAARIADVSGLALEASVTAVRDSMDEASQVANVASLATEASVTAMRDSLQYLVTATGFSTFDASSDSVHAYHDVVMADSIANRVLEDSAYYTTDVSSLALEASVTAMRDSLQYLAMEASLTAIRDSVQYLVTATGFSTLDSTDIADIIKYYVWGNADTSQVDSSDIGAWLVNNLSGSSGMTEASIIDTFYTRLIADTVDGSLWADIVRRVVSYVDASIAGVSGGSGIYTVGVFAVDTSGTDDSVSNISINVQDITGSVIAGPLRTGSDGCVEFNLNADSFVFVADGGAAYDFGDTAYTISGNDSVVVLGYNTVIASPGDASQATLYGYITDAENAPDSGRYVYARRLFSNASDSASGEVVANNLLKDTTDATGHFSFDLIKSTEYSPARAGYYRVWCPGEYNVYDLYYDSLWITGNVNIADSVAAKYGP